MYTTRLLLLCAFGVVFSFAKAQVPQGVNYQAVLRNTQGDIMANTSACYRFTIIDSTTTGPAVYQETHQVTTNQFGLMTVQIGSGTPVQGTFAGIQWAHNSKYLLVELDANCTGTYVIMGQSQMLSVPYALYAGSAGNAQGGLQLWDTAGANIYNFNSGNVGIGTTKPAMLLDVNTAVDTNGSAAIRGTNTGDTTAVYGIAGYVEAPMKLTTLG
jgi:hypothetical protein